MNKESNNQLIRSGLGVFVLESCWPDDFGQHYVPFFDDYYHYPDWLAQRRYYFES